MPTPAPALSLPLLYSKTKEDGLQQWLVWAVGDTVYVEYGKVGGKLQASPGKKIKPVNVGKKNELDGPAHAVEIAKAMHKAKLDRKYALTVETAGDAKGDKPMLAHRYDKFPKHIKFPCDGQPKMDGNRAAARWVGSEGVKLISRSGIEEYEVPHLWSELAALLPKDCELDGELYVHGVHPQTINSWVNKQHPETAQIEYWVYDMPIVDGRDDLPWTERANAMGSLLSKLPKNSKIKLVPTSQIDAATQTTPLLEAYLETGFEGLMLRNLHGRYEWGERSYHLQKVKVFEDAEFEVVGCDEGQGKMAGCAIWRCKTPDDSTGAGATFTCVMKVPLETRRKHYEQPAKYIGQSMTVSFFGTFKSGLPRFPRAIKFRSSADK